MAKVEAKKDGQIISILSQLLSQEILNGSNNIKEKNVPKNIIFKLLRDRIRDNFNEDNKPKSPEASRILSYVYSLGEKRPDPYMILGTTRQTALPEIKKKWLCLIQEFHTDRNPSNETIEELAKLVNWAWSTIKGK
jgi:hypothetical protein